MFLHRVLVVAVLTGVSVGLAGCGSSSTSKGTPSDVTFTNGKLEGVLNAPVVKAAQGARMALQELKLPGPKLPNGKSQDLKLKVIAYSADPSSARIVVLAPNGIRVEVMLLPRDEKTSRIVISTANPNDERALSEAYNAIHKRVG